MFVITNTMSGKKEQFTPINTEHITLYVCGITPYDYAHIGHGRCYVTFDVLYRLLTTKYSNVTYCRNFTDIDDKILNRAQQELHDKNRFHEISEKYMTAFHQDMEQLNCLPPAHEPLVTQTIPEIISLIEALIAKGYAYTVDGDVYYRVTKFKNYGALSKRNLEDLQAGARVEINEKKENPLDFALWKATVEPEAQGQSHQKKHCNKNSFQRVENLVDSEANRVTEHSIFSICEHRNTDLTTPNNKSIDSFWQSPWGMGRPGWHIECSAMAKKYLGESIDIHGGGMDLIFPHHENEIAQSEGAQENSHAKLANVWMHNAFVRIDKEKMSKSLGNFFTLRDVFAHYDPMVIRYYILQHHYRSPLDFAFDDINGAQKAYQKLCKTFAALTTTHITAQTLSESSIAQTMLNFLYDDMNTPGALGVVFENLTAPQQELENIKYILCTILGLTLNTLEETVITVTPEIQKIIDQRAAARGNKDWATADKLRKQLQDLGWDPQDSKL